MIKIIIGIFSFLIFVVCLVYFLRFLDSKKKTKVKTPLYLFKIVYVLLTMKINVEGKENIPSRDGFLVLSNHQSNIDSLILYSIFDGLAFIAKESARRAPFAGKYMEIVGCYFLNRDSLRSAMTIFKGVAKDIENKKTFVLYPEGKRSRKQEMGEFKNGAFLLPKLAKCTIIPVTINNTYKTKFLRYTKVTVVVHKPIFKEYYEFMKAEELNVYVKNIIQDGLQKEDV